MPFPDGVKQAAYQRSNGRCECTRLHQGKVAAPHHGGRCPKRLGTNWHAHHKTAGGLDTISNCEALCIECHQLTRSYGK